MIGHLHYGVTNYNYQDPLQTFLFKKMREMFGLWQMTQKWFPLQSKKNLDIILRSQNKIPHEYKIYNC